MATITGLTAARMLAIEAATVVNGSFDSAGHLILTRHDGTTFDAGVVTDATTGERGVIELATNTEVQAGTDDTRAVTPASLASIPGVKIQILADNSLAETLLPSAYPVGMSVMALKTGSEWTINSGIGTLVTIKTEDDHTTQEFYGNSGGTDTPGSWMRQYHSVNSGGGWTTWAFRGNLTFLNSASFTETTPMADYPIGESRLYYTAVNSGAWEFSGMPGEVLTWHDGGNFARQTWTAHASGPGYYPPVWVRTSNTAGGWSSWREILFQDERPKGIASGRETINPIPDVVTSKVIAFPTGRFTVPPNVVVSAETTVPHTSVTEVSCSNITKDGCELYVYRDNDVATVLQWIATEF